VSDAWMPGATRVQKVIDGGSLKGGAPRAVWLALGADPQLVSARSAAEWLIRHGRACHLVWNPLTGDLVQLIPLVRAGRLIGWPRDSAMLATGIVPGVNTEGRACAQVGVVAYPWMPFTDGPAAGAGEIVDWLDSWHISRRWPAGQPKTFPRGRDAPRSRNLWARGGHYGASQVPGGASAGPGAIDIEALTGAVAGLAAGCPAPGPAARRGSRPAPDTHG
jgi:hypothetical protein